MGMVVGTATPGQRRILSETMSGSETGIKGQARGPDRCAP
jgi:hypothetical protein